MVEPKVDILDEEVEIKEELVEEVIVEKPEEKQEYILPMVRYTATPNSCSIEEIFEKDERNVTVLWSGGMDSTAMLYSLAKQYPERNITAVSFVSANILNAKKDRAARRKLMKVFEKRGIKNIDYNEYKMSADASAVGYYGLGQATLWSILSVATARRNAALLFGYIKGDCVWQLIHYFIETVKNASILSGMNDIKICFPLEVTSKAEILYYLQEQGLYKYCTTCESDGKEPCGTCPSCRKLHFAKMELEKYGV